MKEELKKPEYPRHQARQGRLRQRRRPEVLPGDPGPAAVLPEPQGHHLAHHGRHRRGRALPVDSEYKGKVALTGLGTPNQMREYVKDGTVKEFALWNPADLGYLAGVRRPRRSRRRPHHRRGGRQVQRRQARRATPSAPTATVLLGDPVRLQRRQHRPVQLLSRHAGRRLRARRPAPTPATPSGRPCSASASSSRSSRTGSTEYKARHARGLARHARARCTRPAGTTTRCSCATTAC